MATLFEPRCSLAEAIGHATLADFVSVPVNKSSRLLLAPQAHSAHPPHVEGLPVSSSSLTVKLEFEDQWF